MTVKIKAYAKINFNLEVLSKREDGYHELDTVMQSVSLCDLLSVSKAERIITDNPSVPYEKDICVRAAKAFFNEAGIDGGLFIGVEKHIPAEAGLGGGSADGAAVLRAANALYGYPLSEARLHDAASRVGSDVPFALMGGTMRARGRGERLVPVINNIDCTYVIIKPEGGVNTARAFALYDAEPIKTNADTGLVVKALLEGDLSALKDFARNGLQNAAAALCPGMTAALELLNTEEGLKTAFMTGSGSAVVGIFDNSLNAQKAQRDAKAQGFKSFTAENVPLGTCFIK